MLRYEPSDLRLCCVPCHSGNNYVLEIELDWIAPVTGCPGWGAREQEYGRNEHGERYPEKLTDAPFCGLTIIHHPLFSD
ncbi:hypothetical protein [Tessaracoccus sp. Y1736]